MTIVGRIDPRHLFPLAVFSSGPIASAEKIKYPGENNRVQQLFKMNMA